MRKGWRWVAAVAAVTAVAGCHEDVVCPAGQAECGGRCVEVALDPANCGTCGTTCGAGEACRAGACTACAAACGEGQSCDQGVCRADVYVACLSTNDVRGVTSALAPAGPARDVDEGPVSLAWSGGRLWVSHTFAPPTVVGFEPNVAGETRFTLGGGDLQTVRASGGLLYVTDSTASSLVVIDPARGVVDEVALATPGVAANPTGVAVAGDVAVVALYGYAPAPAFDEGQEIVVVDVARSRTCTTQPCATVLRRIGLDVPRSDAGPGAYDPPGFPFPARVAALGSRAFVTLANLEEECFGTSCYYTKPAGDGRLAIVDATSSAAPVFVDLGPGCTNPGSLAIEGNTVWVSCGGSGALVPVDVSGEAPVVGEPLTLPIVPGAIAACGGELFVGDQYSGKVAKVTASGTVESQEVCTGGSYQYAADVACAGEAP